MLHAAAPSLNRSLIDVLHQFAIWRKVEIYETPSHSASPLVVCCSPLLTGAQNTKKGTDECAVILCGSHAFSTRFHVIRGLFSVCGVGRIHKSENNNDILWVSHAGEKRKNNRN